jgi:hypothetical protein
MTPDCFVALLQAMLGESIDMLHEMIAYRPMGEYKIVPDAARSMRIACERGGRAMTRDKNGRFVASPQNGLQAPCTLSDYYALEERVAQLEERIASQGDYSTFVLCCCCTGAGAIATMFVACLLVTIF